MRFLLSEYINLLKEDKELDTLLTDLLVGMKFTTISKPMKGRQFGVDISAVGIDPEDGIKKVFLLAVKQGNLTRTTWDGNVNAIRSTLNQIKDTYIPISLTTNLKKLPIKIIVSTNGVRNQNVLSDWTQYVEQNITDTIEYDFWGTGEISAMLDDYLINEKLFPQEYQSLLRKSLVFLELPDYDLQHFYALIQQILEKQPKQKRHILKKLRLVRLCLNILYKWSQDNNNLKPSIYASESSLLLTWHFIQEGNHLEKSYVREEFYKIHSLKRTIGVNYFNKVVEHYKVEHSIYKYSRNSLEYSLNVWEEIGIIAIIGLTEIQEFRIHYREGNEEQAQTYYQSALSISNGLCLFIQNNPPSKYPEYDVHSIEIALALNLMNFTRNFDPAKKWISEMTLGFNNNYKLNKFFPLFRKSYEKLVDIHNGEEECDVQSSMIIPILAEYALVFNDEDLYKFVRKISTELFTDLNLQIWFPLKEMENKICIQDYSHGEGTTKHSVTLYEDAEEYKKEMVSEMELFGLEKDFKIFKHSFDIVAHVASRHYKSQPFPLTWRVFMKQEVSTK
ncbi:MULTISPECIES: hypothetical protein [Flavobacteriaceae]|jgi:hypothetical protein|uniref:Restriction endonuclease n=1 Tax=Neotamlana laminarinivorans TaxID=2883124 RepID=A0A9X1L5F7_9FLAO|nr:MULTISPECIES: hypothetical protein [Flavobacteriaceae]MCB4799346.1 hypothetical protein [Tamlana laminarinivorans]